MKHRIALPGLALAWLAAFAPGFALAQSRIDSQWNGGACHVDPDYRRGAIDCFMMIAEQAAEFIGQS